MFTSLKTADADSHVFLVWRLAPSSVDVYWSVAANFAVSMSCSGGTFRCVAAHFIEVSAAVCGLVHLVASRARAFCIGIVGGGGMTAAEAEKRICRSLNHRPEATTQNTVGAADNFGQHHFPVLLVLTIGSRVGESAGGCPWRTCRGRQNVFYRVKLL